MYDLNDYDYSLPEELIAQKPAESRELSRLMILDKKTGKIEETIFQKVADIFTSNDVLVVNNTRVIPVRLFGKMEHKSLKAEVFILHQLEDGRHDVLLKPAKKLPVGTRVFFGDDFWAEIVENEPGSKVKKVKFNLEGEAFFQALHRYGQIPLPPYIKDHSESNIQRYQTTYAKKPGAVAAPTAGLHFTEEVFAALRSNKVKILEITLHTGMGTFNPVEAKDIRQHKMHTENYHVEEQVWQEIMNSKRDGKRIIAVGTTVVRALETIQLSGQLMGETDIFIFPGFKFQIVDAMVTNFHLPKSSLLMLVSAFAGRENIIRAYRYAIENKFRFFSFGDAMFIK